MERDATAVSRGDGPRDERSEVSEHLDRMLVREVLTPAQRLDTLRVVANFFAGARKLN